jgi:hypothetical protein
MLVCLWWMAMHPSLALDAPIRHCLAIFMCDWQAEVAT